MDEFENIIEKARERGYSLHNRTANHSIYNFLRDDGIGLIVYTNAEEFEIYYNVDLVVTLKGGRCGSFMNDKHFASHEGRIAKYAYILKSKIN